MIWKLWWISIYVNKFKLQIKHEPVQKQVRRKTNWTITVDITTRNYKHEVMYIEDMNNTNPIETCHQLGRTQMLQGGNQFLLNYVLFFISNLNSRWPSMRIIVQDCEIYKNIKKFYFQKLWNQIDMSQTVNLLRERQHVNRAKNRI